MSSIHEKKSSVSRPLPLLTQAIKSAISVSRSETGSSHNQLLDSVAIKLGFNSYRALKAAEDLAVARIAPNVTEVHEIHPLVAAFDAFEVKHPGIELVFVVPLQSTEHGTPPNFPLTLDRPMIDRIAGLAREVERISSLDGDLRGPVSFHVGKMDYGREGTSVSLRLWCFDEKFWVSFDSVTYERHFDEISSSHGDLNLEDLISAIEDLAKTPGEALVIERHLVLDPFTVAYRVDENTLGFACEFDLSEDNLSQGSYPVVSDQITIDGYDENAKEADCLEGFVAAVISEEVLSSL